MVDSECQRGNEDPESVPWSVIADEHCRQVIEYVRSADTEVATVEDLVEHAGVADDSVANRRRKTVQFHHITLPKLAAGGVLEYELRQQDVRYQGNDGLESLLDQIDTDESAMD